MTSWVMLSRASPQNALQSPAANQRGAAARRHADFRTSRSGLDSSRTRARMRSAQLWHQVRLPRSRATSSKASSSGGRSGGGARRPPSESRIP